MSTLTTTQPVAAPGRPLAGLIPGDQRIIIRGVGPDLYKRLDAAIGEGQHIRLAYDGEDLELMTTGHLHELFKELLGSVMRALMLGLGIEFGTGGQATWKSDEADRGLEADLSYYFDPGKIRLARELAARKSNDPADYPVPDLTVEIDVSTPQVDRPAIYALLRFPEVWRFDGDVVRFEQLQPDGSYAPAETSGFLPIGPADIRRWLVEEDSSHRLDWERRPNQWAMGLGRQAP